MSFVPFLYIVCLSPYSQDVCPPWSLRGCWWFMRGVFVVLEILDVPRVHQGCYISIFRCLPFWKVVKLLQSGRPWFSRAPSKCPPWSLRGPWWLPREVLVVFTRWMPQRNIKEATYQFSDLYLPGKYSICYVSQECQHKSLIKRRQLVPKRCLDAPRIQQFSDIYPPWKGFNSSDLQRVIQVISTILRSIPSPISWEVFHLQCDSRTSSWSQGSCISIYRSLPLWKGFQLLSSPEHNQVSSW